MKINDWDLTKTVTLSTGRVVTVRAVPPYVSIRAAELYPMPDPPQLRIRSKLPGAVDEIMDDEKDPAYIKAVMDTMTKRREAVNEAQWLYSLPDVKADEDDSWREAIEEAVPNIVWRQGARGRRMDYIEWVILSNPRDLKLLQDTIAELNSEKEPISEALLQAAEESFRDQVQRDTVKEV